ncbi:MAG: amino acid permease [Planctomycetota bacterium]|jgi:amino acid transporter/mannitol/fructose-specific phosphotransferase system IIA component (Ntr-type)
MAILHKSRRLKKELSLFSVYAIATGTTLSAGFFLLPGLAAREAGPAVVLAYVVAAALLVPAMLSIVELATAMPRAGGAYYFLDRSLGPLAGTIGGVGTWLALVLKAAFALVGMGAYVALIVDMGAGRFPAVAGFMDRVGLYPIAATLAILFGIVNLLGASKTGRFQMVLVFGLLAILAWFIAHGSAHVEFAHFAGFFDAGFESIVATAGLVFISYVGVTKVASVSEEVKHPDRNLPLGIFMALGTAVLVYALGVGVMVGVVGAPELQHTYTPVEKTVEQFTGRWGVALVCVAAMLAFSSVANAGILSASRYPLAMARDHLLPPFFGTLTRGGTPRISICLTVGAVLAFLFLLRDPAGIAKLASGFQLLIFGLICLAVIIMRQSGLESYDPGYKAPFYPWLQIVGILTPIWIIAEMGWLPILFTSGMVAVGILWYRGYARKRVDRHGAVYHVFEKLGRRRYVGLDRELRSILKEKGLREEDPFEEVVARAFVIVGKPRDTFERIAERASTLLAQRLPCTSETLVEGFLKGTRIGATPVSGGVALPHLRLPGIDAPQMVLVRCPTGVPVPVGDVLGGPESVAYDTYAIFFLVSPDKNPGQHLRLLAELAGRVDQDEFIASWLEAGDEQRLKEILLRSDRYVSLPVTRGTATEPLIGRPLREVSFPEGCLVAIIRRQGETIVPRGSTVVLEGDWLTVIGSTRGIGELRRQYGADEPPDNG